MLRELSKVEQRYDAVLAVIQDGMRVTEVAEKFGVQPHEALTVGESTPLGISEDSVVRCPPSVTGRLSAR
jgi:hypothetical protein